jgi:hypothetical protein
MLRCGFVVEHLAEPWEHTPAVTWVHWPEAMFGWREPTQAEVERFEQWIEACASRGLLLWTVHNAFPHGWRGSRRFGHVYRLVAERAHVHLHHGHQSIREITRRYPSARPRISRTHPHGGCWHLVGDLTPDAARARLSLRSRDRILLVFGEVRTPPGSAISARCSPRPGIPPSTRRDHGASCAPWASSTPRRWRPSGG